jgi:hypothetical protein
MQVTLSSAYSDEWRDASAEALGSLYGLTGNAVVVENFELDTMIAHADGRRLGASAVGRLNTILALSADNSAEWNGGVAIPAYEVRAAIEAKTGAIVAEIARQSDIEAQIAAQGPLPELLAQDTRAAFAADLAAAATTIFANAVATTQAQLDAATDPAEIAALQDILATKTAAEAAVTSNPPSLQTGGELTLLSDVPQNPAAPSDCTACTVACEVNTWGVWGTCSQSCDQGVQQRTRSVDVWPANGGAGCPSTCDQATMKCTTQ